MKVLSIKGIVAGLAAQAILSIPVGMMFGYYFLAIYNDIAPAISSFDSSKAIDLKYEMQFHPLFIAFVVVSTIIDVGIPAYIAALVAGKAYMLNAMVVGVIPSLLILLDVKLLAQNLTFFTITTVFALVIAYWAGRLRRKQVQACND